MNSFSVAKTGLAVCLHSIKLKAYVETIVYSFDMIEGGGGW